MKKINLLHLITELEPGGAENLLLNICRKSDKEKINISVGYIFGPGMLADQFIRAGVQVFDLSRKGKVDPLLIFRLFFLIRREKIRIVHTHLVHATVIGRIAARLAGVEILVTTRHYAYQPKERTLVYRLERKSARLNDMTIAISQAVRDYLTSKENYDSKKITVIYNAVNLELFATNITKQATINSRKHLIGTVGHLYPQKGHDILIRSMSEIVEAFPETGLLIIGNGPQGKRLRHLAHQLKLSNHVSFLGSLSPQQVIRVLGDIDIFMLASNWEGFGIAVIEAMASGKPVVATAVEGLLEVIENGRTGFLVPPGQPQALAKKVIHLLRNRNLSIEMGREGRKRVESLFSLDNMIMKLEKIYLELLDQKGLWNT